MQDAQRAIKSFAIEVLRDPTYLAALEAGLLRGEAPDIDQVRYEHMFGPVPEGIRWHPTLRLWVGQVYVNDRLVYRGQHRLLKDAVQALDEALYYIREE